jgi:hypothetical protein
MMRISITAAAFDAVAATLPGTVREPDGKGERQIWLEPRFVDRLRALRGQGESYSDVILRLAEELAATSRADRSKRAEREITRDMPRARPPAY